jgi:pyridoxamine 5'-phosphate oxidase
MSIEYVRKDYSKDFLIEENCPQNPIHLLDTWLKEAVEKSVDANAMTISSVGQDGMPSSRIVLIRKLEDRGLSFFTNYKSKKGTEFEMHNKVAVNFFWPWAERQVRVQGIIEKLTPEESDAYFDSRPRASQLGAWASDQSKKVGSREELENILAAIEKKYDGVRVPRPAHWGGYLIRPRSIEFWQGRQRRLHDRIAYEQNQQGAWDMFRLNP